MSNRAPTHFRKTKLAFVESEKEQAGLIARLSAGDVVVQPAQGLGTARRRFDSCLEAKPDRAAQLGRTGINPTTGKRLINLNDAPSAMEQHMAALSDKHRYGKA